MHLSQITWQVSANELEFLAEGAVVCRAVETAALPVGVEQALPIHRIAPWRIDGNGAARSTGCGPWLVSDTVERSPFPEAPLFVWRRSWQNRSEEPQEARLCLEWETAYPPGFTLIPAVNYNGNGWGSGMEPRGLVQNGEPWTFAAHRISVPAGTYSEGNPGSLFVFAGPSAVTPPGCSAALAPAAGGLLHRLIWPEEERPQSYAHRDVYAPPYHSSLRILPGATLEVTAYLVILPPTRPHTAWRHGLDTAWALFHREPDSWFPPETLWQLAIRFAHESLWYEGPEFTGFSIGLQRREAGWIQRPTDRYEIGWCGQNAAFGAALLQDYLSTGDNCSLSRGEKVLDFWAENARLPNGLFWTRFDEKIENSKAPCLDTCNLGHGAYQYLVASELAVRCGLCKPEWREMALAACDFFVEQALPDGTFGSAWTPGGECLRRGGTTGAFLLWPLLKAFRLTQQDQYLHVAQRAFHTYVERDLEMACCGGGALDTDCIDKESAFPLAMAAVDLYELTGETEYLRRAEDAGCYLASWQWHYSAPLPPGSAMRELGYDTCGGTSVSAGHHHQDPWGALLALAWLRLAKATGRQIWRERARAAWRQAAIGISDGSLEVYDVRRPAGSQDEGFYHTSWTAGGTAQRGDVTEWLVAWPSAFRLITLMHWPDWEDFR